MLKSSVLKIIRTFSKEEISEFNDFLNSPYFNKKSGVVKLYNEIKKYYPDFTDENLGNEKLWNKLYPGKKYGYGVMKNLIYDITKLAEMFITHQKHRSNDIQEFALLYKVLSERKLMNLIINKENFLNKKYNDKELKNLKIPAEEFYFQLAGIYDIKLSNIFLNGYGVANLDRENYEFQDSLITGLIILLINHNENSRVFSFSDKADSKSNILSEVILNYLNDEFFEKILSSIKKRSVAKYILLNSYYLAYKATTTPEDSNNYFIFKKYFYSNFKSLPHMSVLDMVDFYNNILSLCTDQTFDKQIEHYEFYQFRHKNNLFLHRSGSLDFNSFNTYLFMFVNSNNISDLEEYVACYSDFINDDDKQASLIVAQSVNHFLKSEFAESLNLISKINFKLFFLKNLQRKFTLMLYYELNYFEEFENAFDSHKHFLKYGNFDNKDTYKLLIEKSKDFSNCVKLLFKLREKPDINELIEFEKKNIEKNGDMRKWVLRKLEEIKFKNGLTNHQKFRQTAS